VFRETLLLWKLVLGLFIDKGTQRLVTIRVYDSDKDDSCPSIARKGIRPKWVIPFRPLPQDERYDTIISRDAGEQRT
jgi:hypothetical protein